MPPPPVPLCARALSRSECRSPPRLLLVSPSHPGQQMAHLSHMGLADAPPRGEYSAPRANHAAANLGVASSFARLYPLSRTDALELGKRTHAHSGAAAAAKTPPSSTTYPSPCPPSCPCWSPNAAGVAHTMLLLLLSDMNASKPEGGHPISPGLAELAGRQKLFFASHKRKSKQQQLPSPSVVRPPTPAAAGNSNRSAIGPPRRPTFYENHAAPASRLAACL